MPENKAGWAIWIVGLPGCGKSTLANGILEHLATRGMSVTLLQMDERRKSYFPHPTYSSEEREKAYALFVDEVAGLVRQGVNVLMDGSAYRRSMRQYARQELPRFAEVFVQCDLSEAARRESSRPNGLVMAGLYAKALQRKKTGQQFEGLGEVIGVDVEFEMDPAAEFIVDNSQLDPRETLGKVLHFVDTWLANV
ncbi:adenylyl-sulfate kinase [uncultured Pseudodesulfovibrio sp.]|uniref:adenylyl-sulfate kinase n=1 Tax=uncultured Pseudodesulfovibrio sp. TaxID=2035858 RepID=UPI0029C8B81F|nr:adenylyl-sulfate kinase [uncultured Pseudodesulfovibrio sp.]